METTRNQVEASLKDAEGGIEFYKFFYEKQAEKWKNETDDRRLFVNHYNAILEMYEDLKYCKSSSTIVAIHERAKKYEIYMKTLLERFKGR